MILEEYLKNKPGFTILALDEIQTIFYGFVDDQSYQIIANWIKNLAMLDTKCQVVVTGSSSVISLNCLLFSSMNSATLFQQALYISTDVQSAVEDVELTYKILTNIKLVQIGATQQHYLQLKNTQLPNLEKCINIMKHQLLHANCSFLVLCTKPMTIFQNQLQNHQQKYDEYQLCDSFNKIAKELLNKIMDTYNHDYENILSVKQNKNLALNQYINGLAIQPRLSQIKYYEKIDEKYYIGDMLFRKFYVNKVANDFDPVYGNWIECLQKFGECEIKVVDLSQQQAIDTLNKDLQNKFYNFVKQVEEPTNANKQSQIKAYHLFQKICSESDPYNMLQQSRHIVVHSQNYQCISAYVYKLYKEYFKKRLEDVIFTIKNFTSKWPQKQNYANKNVSKVEYLQSLDQQYMKICSQSSITSIQAVNIMYDSQIDQILMNQTLFEKNIDNYQNQKQNATHHQELQEKIKIQKQLDETTYQTLYQNLKQKLFIKSQNDNFLVFVTDNQYIIQQYAETNKLKYNSAAENIFIQQNQSIYDTYKP
ncbi:Hypothetical_protein [Hexamita inflata]|uniref:Hypothetical_protein n=1 Tax=Hexamita inflata TaxID=28002 RepID=A0AA86QJ98_9EUKA|nr:Hypothetical protein HINF_LOCUS48066 [Hexamita inflata]